MNKHHRRRKPLALTPPRLPPDSKFVQIAVCTEDGADGVYALDADGNVWLYSVVVDSDADGMATEAWWQLLPKERRA